ncbi:MAG TPA: 3-oxoacyl-ACP reductase FabG [Candidatus Anaerobiospirillum stercoravium]|nr:3-oxoacyl-ACP reductase FabG [Candidatus Anaerobiospirillum stercoravium]
MTTNATKGKGRRVLVTGASRGIGQGVALRLAQDGFFVVVHYGHDQQGAQHTLNQITAHGGAGALLQFDVGQEEQCRRVLEQEVEQNGAFYGVVSNAGISRDDAFPGMSSANWHEVINTNLNAFYHVVQPLIMPMIRLRHGGRIIVMSSVSGLGGNRGQTNYAASKAGLIGAAKSLALELGKRNITVNAVAPGLIDTEMVQLDDTVLTEAMKLIPLRRMGTVTEVAGLVSYLMSDEAAYVTRQVISINGGLL